MSHELVVDNVLLKQAFEDVWVSAVGQVWTYSKRHRQFTWATISTNPEGRKVVHVSGHVTNVAQLVALAWIGPVPEDKPWVLHKDSDCSNDYYTNLYYGTPSDNVQDMLEANRQNYPSGILSPHAELSEEQVVEIFQRLQKGESQSSLAREFHTTQSNVWNIRHKKTWKSLLKDLV